MTRNRSARPRGAAALGVVLMLLAALALAVGMAQRNLMFEQRSSANQLRSTRAFEAAESGLAWALAQLNRGAAIGADCEPASAAPGDTDFRTRYLAFDAATGRFAPRSLATADGPRPLQAACVATDAGWSCQCPADREPEPLQAGDGAPRPVFHLRFMPAERAGMVEFVATGCDQPGPGCRADAPEGAAAGAAGAQVRATLALLPALATLPSAALTALGAIDADGALMLANEDAASDGIAARAGGTIALPAAQLVTLPGRSAGESLQAQAPVLAGLEAERLLARILGVDRARWRALPGVRTLDCSTDCSAALAEAGATTPGATLLWAQGDLALDGPLTLGSAEHPLMLVVEGQVRLQGEVTIHGVVVTLAGDWDTSASGGGAQVRGAVVALGAVRGSGSLAVVRDPEALARLHRATGHFVRVAGSWRDF